MGDDGNKIIGENKTQEQEPKPIKLLITLHPNGKVDIAGPIQDRILCYGLLEIAKEVIYDFKNATKVEIPNQHGILNFARKFKR